jgi:hypothetical protein
MRLNESPLSQGETDVIIGSLGVWLVDFGIKQYIGRIGIVIKLAFMIEPLS